MSANVSSNGSIISGLNKCDYFNLNDSCNPSNDVEVRKIYSRTLQTMKTAHLTAYYQTQSEIHEGKEGIRLPRLFASFHPSPIKLAIIELCKKPIDSSELPEIFKDLEHDLVALSSHYQMLELSSREVLVEDLIEDTESEGIEFHDELDAFLEMMEKRFSESEISSLLNTFQTDVSEAKEFLDFFFELIKRDKNLEGPSELKSLSEKVLLNRAFLAIVESGELSRANTKILAAHFPKLNEIREKYNSLCSYEKYLLIEDCALGGDRLLHDPIPREVLREARIAVGKISLAVRSHLCRQ